eukprot:GFYU01004270.1.p1 GENE.GFYU01004270.1~~GFYU01004270.1.p1  ORF type:complete len:225 (+),score=17.95 GFYU01004270.1:228-902(+)
MAFSGDNYMETSFSYYDDKENTWFVSSMMDEVPTLKQATPLQPRSGTNRKRSRPESPDYDSESGCCSPVLSPAKARTRTSLKSREGIVVSHLDEPVLLNDEQDDIDWAAILTQPFLKQLRIFVRDLEHLSRNTTKLSLCKWCDATRTVVISSIATTFVGHQHPYETVAKSVNSILRENCAQLVDLCRSETLGDSHLNNFEYLFIKRIFKWKDILAVAPKYVPFT